MPGQNAGFLAPTQLPCHTSSKKEGQGGEGTGRNGGWHRGIWRPEHLGLALGLISCGNSKSLSLRDRVSSYLCENASFPPGFSWELNDITQLNLLSPVFDLIKAVTNGLRSFPAPSSHPRAESFLFSFSIILSLRTTELVFKSFILWEKKFSKAT